jgi:hypothetical protein
VPSCSISTGVGVAENGVTFDRVRLSVRSSKEMANPAMSSR